MHLLTDYYEKIGQTDHRAKLESVIQWVISKFPSLELKIAWNQPMFTDHGTFIIGFSVAANHFAVAPELVTINHFSKDIISSGYTHTKQLIRFPWNQPVDFMLLERIIRFNIDEKKDCQSFWRK